MNDKIKINSIVILCILGVCSCAKAKYSYACFNQLDNSYSSMTFDINNNKLILNDGIINTKYKNCSDNEFKCITVGEDIFYVPKKIKAGEFTSKYGKYSIYKNISSRLPFNKNMEYYVIDYKNNSAQQSYKVFYNNKIGIIAILLGESNPVIYWLIDKYGLFSAF